jgi:hypothetical protein
MDVFQTDLNIRDPGLQARRRFLQAVRKVALAGALDGLLRVPLWADVPASVGRGFDRPGGGLQAVPEGHRQEGGIEVTKERPICGATKADGTICRGIPTSTGLVYDQEDLDCG